MHGGSAFKRDTGIHSNVHGVYVQTYNKNSSIDNSSIEDSSIDNNNIVERAKKKEHTTKIF